MDLGISFNAGDLPESTSYDPIPAGWYSAKITGAEVKTTKAGDGQYIAVRYDITGPSHEGRVVFANINFKNPNPKAEEIARQQIGEIIRAIGLASLSDSDQLLGGDLMIKVSVRKSEEYGDSNDIKGFKAISGSAPMTAPAQQPAAPAASAPPWAK